ncbi:MAG: hypothetical protein IPK03_13110 [Bacteroidetes bacterium]|nr:hypothetical protein [Bacteroidota bacterium]
MYDIRLKNDFGFTMYDVRFENTGKRIPLMFPATNNQQPIWIYDVRYTNYDCGIPIKLQTPDSKHHF